MKPAATMVLLALFPHKLLDDPTGHTGDLQLYLLMSHQVCPLLSYYVPYNEIRMKTCGNLFFLRSLEITHLTYTKLHIMSFHGNAFYIFISF